MILENLFLVKNGLVKQSELNQQTHQEEE